MNIFKKVKNEHVMVICVLAVMASLITVLAMLIHAIVSGDSGNLTVAAIITFVLIFSCVAFIVLQRLWLFRPIRRMLKLATRVADGDVDFDIQPLHDISEASILNNELVRLVQNQRDFSQVMQTVAARDLTARVNMRSEKDMVAKSLQIMIDSNNETMSQINAASENVANASQSMMKSSEALSRSAMAQAGAIEEITATVTQIAIQSKQISENSAIAKKLSDKIMRYAGEGNERMSVMLSSMKGIGEAANNISEIIKAIDEISFKTNILALNAAVEAARAGHDGKGFAVVAAEVRSLAGQSARAAKKTEDLILDMVQSVNSGAQVADETAGSLSKILDAVNQNAPLIESISVATNEQYIGIEQANQAIEQVANATDRTSKFAEESAMAGQELSAQAELLRTMVKQYKLAENTPEDHSPDELDG